MQERKLTFYTHPMSRGRVARWMLEETGLPYQQEILEFGPTMKSPDYLAINPMGKVPAIRHGDTVVTENTAIALYLADLVPERRLAPPVGSPERGPYYRWISFLAPLEQAMSDKANGTKLDPGQAGYGTLEDVVSALEGAVRGRDHLAGENFTAADLLVAAYLGWYMQFKLLEPRSELARFVQLHMGRDAAKRANGIDDALMQAAGSTNASG